MGDEGRAYAHYMRARMYAKHGNEKKARAHMRRAMCYYSSGGSTRFGEPVVDANWTFRGSKVHGGRGEGVMHFAFRHTDGTAAEMIVKGLSEMGKDDVILQYEIFGVNDVVTDEGMKQKVLLLTPSLLNALLVGVNIENTYMIDMKNDMPVDHPAFAEFERGAVWKDIKLKTGPASDFNATKDGRPFSTPKYEANSVLRKLINWARRGKNGFYVSGADYLVDFA